MKSFKLTFNINEVEIGLITETSIDVKEGDYVIVAGEDNLNGVFNGYSLKNLN